MDYMLMLLEKNNDRYGGHFFEDATLKFFGDKYRQVEGVPDRPELIVYSCKQNNAPEGYPRWRAAVFVLETGTLLYNAQGRGSSRKVAIREAINNIE